MPSLPCNPTEEADYMLELHGGESNMVACLHMFSDQFAILQSRSQLLLTLATIVLTITGFSGPRIAASGAFARGAMAFGLFLTLSAIIVLLLNLRIRWLTQFCETSPRETLITIINYRESKRRVYLSTISLLIVGLASYVAAIVAFLLTGDAAPH